MDRMAQTALNSLKMLMENQTATSHNLSNLSTPGYRQDVVTDFGSIYLNRQNGVEPRIVSSRNVGGFSTQQGSMETTGNPLDVALDGNGYFLIEPRDGGKPALSRRGDLQTSETGELLDGAGNKLLDDGLQPIVLPAFRRIDISPNGELIIEPTGAEPDALPINVGLIATFVPGEDDQLKKTLDGHIRLQTEPDENGQISLAEIVPNNQGKLVAGILEKSNVNAVEEMVNTIDQQRKFEMHVKMIQMTEELDSVGASLMRLPGM